MKPTQKEIEDDLRKLASQLGACKDQFQTLKTRLSPYINQLGSSLEILNESSGPRLKRAKLGLEVMLLKSRLKIVDALIKTKRRGDQMEKSREGNEARTDDHPQSSVDQE